MALIQANQKGCHGEELGDIKTSSKNSAFNQLAHKFAFYFFDYMKTKFVIQNRHMFIGQLTYPSLLFCTRRAVHRISTSLGKLAQ